MLVLLVSEWMFEYIFIIGNWQLAIRLSDE